LGVHKRESLLLNQHTSRKQTRYINLCIYATMPGEQRKKNAKERPKAGTSMEDWWN
jgi:hypothetical protein